jgi:acyl-coenzyme A synthetase/AMP-(fatty) acid ligase
MTALLAFMSPRVWIAVALAVALAGTHWKAYTTGKQAVQLEWDAATAEATAVALAAEQAARAREQALQTKVRKVANDYQVEKTRRAAADQLAADSLRQLQAAIASGGKPAPDPAAPAGTDDDPRDGIIAECAGALVKMDQAVRSLADQTRALQGYAAGVCVAP